MLLRNLLLPAVIAPSAAALLVLLLGFLFRKREGSLAGGAWALAAAFVAAFVTGTGWPRWFPVEATQRLFFVVLAAALIAWVVAKAPKQAGLAAKAVLLATLLGLFLHSQIQHRWSLTEAALWLGALFLVGLLLDRVLAGHLEEHTWQDAGVRLALLGMTAVLLGLSGSAWLGQLMGAVACAATVVEAVGLLRKRPAWSESDSIAWAVPLFGLVLGGYFYAELSPWHALLVLAAFLLLTVAKGGPLWKRALPLLPMVIALGWLGWTLANQEEDPYDYYGSLSAPAQAVPAPEEARHG